MKVSCYSYLTLVSNSEITLEPRPSVFAIRRWLAKLPEDAVVSVNPSTMNPNQIVAYWEEER